MTLADKIKTAGLHLSFDQIALRAAATDYANASEEQQRPRAIALERAAIRYTLSLQELQALEQEQGAARERGRRR